MSAHLRCGATHMHGQTHTSGPDSRCHHTINKEGKSSSLSVTLSSHPNPHSLAPVNLSNSHLLGGTFNLAVSMVTSFVFLGCTLAGLKCCCTQAYAAQKYLNRLCEAPQSKVSCGFTACSVPNRTTVSLKVNSDLRTAALIIIT